MGVSKYSRPPKRSLPTPAKIIKQEVRGSVKLWHCSDCANRGKMIVEYIYLCNKLVNAPYGNHSIIGCIYFLTDKK